MKVAVSIPDPVFAEAEALAKRMKLSRSGVYARALGDFIAANADDQVTGAMNAVVDDAGTTDSSFTREAARKVFARTEW